ncbi:MAG: sigma-54 dependent transcriptional regulator [Candidatus Kapaibacteriales bacterium]
MILIADDNQDFCSTISSIVEGFGHKTVTFNSPDEAINYIDSNHSKLDLLLLDVEFGPSATKTGIDILGHSKSNYPAIPAVMISGKGTIDTAVEATKLGALNFIEKAIVSSDRIKKVLESALKKLEDETEFREIQKLLAVNGLIGESEAMKNIGELIIRFGRTDLNILITGETGTGKKLIANAVHSVSRRNRNQMVTVDIPNIPRELFQSELFGHVKGSFSGATETKKGLFHQAHKSSIFLDEIGDMPPELQANLLIPVEDKIIRKVGSVQPEEIDVRFISATDKDLPKAMQEGTFREQLYHRLRECGIFIPPLRDRKEDIPPIIDYYLGLHNKQYDQQKHIAPAAITLLQSKQWPGNVRELTSLLRVALQTSLKDRIEVEEIEKMARNNERVLPSQVSNTPSNPTFNNEKTLKEDMETMDKMKVQQTLEDNRGNVSKSAVILGVSRETLHNKIRKYEINVQEYRRKKA